MCAGNDTIDDTMDFDTTDDDNKTDVTVAANGARPQDSTFSSTIPAVLATLIVLLLVLMVAVIVTGVYIIRRRAPKRCSHVPSSINATFR